MKIFSSILVLAILVGAAAILWPQDKKNIGVDISINDNTETKLEPATQAARITAPAPPISAAQTATTPSAPPTTLTRGSNNQIEVDGRYTILGSGTELDPYRITWELLKSAYETMDLNGERVAPPKRVEMLNGTYVQISGYLAPPLWGQETKELLVMFNKWDGCCIGLPPTPFDCIEAQLAAPIKLGAAHTISYGAIRGKFIVEPFKAGKFLIGLYRLEEAQTDDTKPRN